MKKILLILAICFAWLIIAALVDGLIFKSLSLFYTRIFAFDNVSIQIANLSKEIKQISLSTFFILPLIIFISTQLYLYVKEKKNIKDLLKKIQRPFIYSLWIFAAIFVGHIIFSLLSGLDWKPIKVISNVTKDFYFEGELILFSINFFRIKVGLDALAGLVAGILIVNKSIKSDK